MSGVAVSSSLLMLLVDVEVVEVGVVVVGVMTRRGGPERREGVYGEATGEKGGESCCDIVFAGEADAGVPASEVPREIGESWVEDRATDSKGAGEGEGDLESARASSWSSSSSSSASAVFSSFVPFPLSFPSSSSSSS